VNDNVNFVKDKHARIQPTETFYIIATNQVIERLKANWKMKSGSD
jgi:hypothetical protein